MSLRDDLIEAIARRLADHDTVLLEDAPEVYLPLAAEILDAMLDKLEEHADEHPEFERKQVYSLLAVLRDV